MSVGFLQEEKPIKTLADFVRLFPPDFIVISWQLQDLFVPAEYVPYILYINTVKKAILYSLNTLISIPGKKMFKTYDGLYITETLHAVEKEGNEAFSQIKIECFWCTHIASDICVDVNNKK